MSMLMIEIFNRNFSEENDDNNKAIKMLQLVFVLVFSDTYDEASHCRWIKVETKREKQLGQWPLYIKASRHLPEMK